MANNYIKQFLVSLGWEIDKEGMKDFARSIAIQTEAVHVLADTLRGGARQVVDFARDLVNSLDDAYLASRQLHTTVSNLNALGYAGEQAGLSLGELQGHAASLLNLTRTKPGILQALGLKPDDAKDSVELLHKVALAVRRFGQAQYIFAETQLGIGGPTLEILQSDAFWQSYAEHLQRVGDNEEKAADGAYKFKREVRRAKDEARALADQGLVWLMDRIRELIAWWNGLSDGVKTTIEVVGGIVAGLGGLTLTLGAAGIAVRALSISFRTLRGVTLGLAAAFRVLGIAIRFAFTNPIGLAILAIAALGYAIYKLVQDFQSWKAGGDSWFPWTRFIEDCRFLTAEVKVLAEVFGDTLRPVLADTRDLLADIFTGHWSDAKQKANDIAELTKTAVERARTGIAEAHQKVEEQTRADEAARTGNSPSQDAAAPAGTPSVDPRRVPNATLGIRNNNPGNLMHKIGPDQYAPNVYATAQDGLNALVANLRDYARKGRDTIQSIISRWAPETDGYGNKINNTKEYIAFAARNMHVAANAHLNMSDPSVLRALAENIELFENNRVNPYSADMYAAAVQKALERDGTKTAQDVTINQTVTNNVTGSSDPKEAAGALTSTLSTSNGLLIRALQPRLS